MNSKRLAMNVNGVFKVMTIEANASGVSVFGSVDYGQSVRGGMLLSDQILAKNFRFRRSASGYQTDFHLAGDDTLIIVQQGTLRIHLQNGDCHDFGAGEMFIAKDHLKQGVVFDSRIHGHQAEVVGDVDLMATHIKLG